VSFRVRSESNRPLTGPAGGFVLKELGAAGKLCHTSPDQPVVRSPSRCNSEREIVLGPKNTPLKT